MNKFPAIVLVLAFGIALAGCGYSTRTILPGNVRTVHVEQFKNSIDFTNNTGRNVYLPLLEVDARNEVVDRFLFDGSLKIADASSADLILKGNLKNYKRSGLRFSDDEDVEEYRIHVTVAFEMWNRAKGELEWSEPNFVGEATYFVTGPNASTEEAAVDKALVDLARRIVERTIEDW